MKYAILISFVLCPLGVLQAAEDKPSPATCDWSSTEWISDGKPLPTRDEDFYRDDAAPQLRKTFDVRREIKSAKLNIVGLGLYEASVNGTALADNALAPLWTPFGKRVLYDTYDVTGLLR